MAWNRPNGVAPPRVQYSNNRKLLRVFIVGLCIIAFCGLFVYLILFLHGEDGLKNNNNLDKDHWIVQVSNIVKLVNADEINIETNHVSKSPKKKRFETYVDGAGVLRYKKGDGRVPNPEEFKNPIFVKRTSCIPAFRHETESEIAMLITLDPGDPLVGEADYRFTRKDFLESLVDKIEFVDDDTPYAREIKEAVIATKKELAERVKNGEDIVDILREARQELQRSFAYKDEIDNILREQLRNPDTTEEDLKTAIEAANKMLTDRGIAPIKEKSFLMRRKKIEQARKLISIETGESK